MNVILPIILVVALITTFLILRKKNINGTTLEISEEDIIEYTPKNSVLTIFEMLLLDEINYHRKSIGIPELIPEKQCRDLAYKHTEYMINKGKPSHDNTFERRYELFRRGATLYGENVAYGYSTGKSFFNAYIKSDGHKKIIETSHFTHIGVRVLQNSDNKYYNSLIFCRYE